VRAPPLRLTNMGAATPASSRRDCSERLTISGVHFAALADRPKLPPGRAWAFADVVWRAAQPGAPLLLTRRHRPLDHGLDARLVERPGFLAASILSRVEVASSGELGSDGLSPSRRTRALAGSFAPRKALGSICPLPKDPAAGRSGGGGKVPRATVGCSPPASSRYVRLGIGEPKVRVKEGRTRRPPSGHVRINHSTVANE
jgi:hypothetical protein